MAAERGRLRSGEHRVAERDEEAGDQLAAGQRGAAELHLEVGRGARPGEEPLERAEHRPLRVGRDLERVEAKAELAAALGGHRGVPVDRVARLVLEGDDGVVAAVAAGDDGAGGAEIDAETHGVACGEATTASASSEIRGRLGRGSGGLPQRDRLSDGSTARFGGMTTPLNGLYVHPARVAVGHVLGHLVVSGEPQPQTQRPKGALLLISCGPVEQLPGPRSRGGMRSMRVHS